MAKINRVLDNKTLQDPFQIEAIEYNPSSGGKKHIEVGPYLIPIPIVSGGSPTWTTNVSAATALPKFGMNLAIYNNSSSAASVTIGNASTITSQAIGAVDASGNAGIALKANDWTYLSMGYNQWIISSASTVIVYIIDDPTKLAQETGSYVQQNPPFVSTLPIDE